MEDSYKKFVNSIPDKRTKFHFQGIDFLFDNPKIMDDSPCYTIDELYLVFEQWVNTKGLMSFMFYIPIQKTDNFLPVSVKDLRADIYFREAIEISGYIDDDGNFVRIYQKGV